MLTVFTSKYSCIWFSQAKGFNVNTHEGWCIKDLHIEKSDKIQTLKEALFQYKKIKLKQLKKQVKTEAKLNKLVTIDDSVKAGNCLTGTMHFKNKYFPNTQAVTIKEILEKEDTIFTRRLLSVV